MTTKTITPEIQLACEEAFAKNDFFNALSEQEKGQLVNIASIGDYKKGEIVFSSQQDAHYLFVVSQGTFVASIGNDKQKLFRPGEIFGEIGIVNDSVRSGTVWANEDARTVEICGTRLFDPNFVDSSLGLKITRALARKITDYLRTKEQIPTLELMTGGESEYVEFKSSMRVNLRSGQVDKSMELAVIKTIAAFYEYRWWHVIDWC